MAIGAHPSGRIGGPDEVPWAITERPAPGTSSVTGVVFAVDGGAGPKSVTGWWPCSGRRPMAGPTR